MGSTILSVKNVAGSNQSGAVLDLFTQKVPYGGIGPNAPSDAFQPQELVILYASVTYNGAAVIGKLVSYQVEGPANAFSNESVLVSSITNESGLATFSFRVPWPNEHPEEIIFGTWFVVATVDVAQQTVSDMLTFQVGWILQVIGVATSNSELTSQTTFLRLDTIDFNLTVKNIAMVKKPAAVTIEVIDTAGYPIISIIKENLTFQPGESYVDGSSTIPATAAIGNATVWAAIYNALPKKGGVLYSPPISTEFEIVEQAPTPSSIDVAITNASLSANELYVGQVLGISVTAANLGSLTETFNVTVYCNGTAIGLPIKISLNPNAKKNLSFSWNTTGASAGVYTIIASASQLPGETSISNNNRIAGQVTLVQRLPFIPRNLYLILVVVLLLFLLALLALFAFRRRKRDDWSELLEQMSLFM
jgi:hypothetical protein